MAQTKTRYCKDLTKEHLQSLGIDSISPDGNHIIKNGVEMKQFTITAHHKYGRDISYKVVEIYDPEYYQWVKAKGVKYPSVCRIFPVQRVVYAWFTGLTRAHYDIDHIDDNKFNNHINNLQEITRAENIRRRKAHNNQWKYIKKGE